MDLKTLTDKVDNEVVNTTVVNTTQKNKIVDVDKKIPGVSGLVAATVLYTKIKKVDNKILTLLVYSNRKILPYFSL